MPLGGEGGAEFFLAQDFGGAHLATAAGIFVAAGLVRGFCDDLRDFDAVTSCVDGDEGEVRRGDVTQPLLTNVFHHGLDADFHGGAEGSIDAGLEDEQIANLDGGYEVEVVHGGGNDKGARMAAGSHGTNEIHELHEAATEEGTEGVGVGGKDDLAAFRLGGADGAGTGAIGHSSIVIAAYFCPQWEEPIGGQVASGEGVQHPKGMDKIGMLSEILQQNPKDAFARYGLAMAYAAEGKMDEALREFATTTEYNPDYVPAYQMAAQTLVKAGKFDEARAKLKEGLAACDRTGNAHAASEMNVMRDEIAEL